MFIHFYLVYVRHLLNTIVFLSFLAPLWLSALVRLMVAPPCPWLRLSAYVLYL